MAVLPPSVKTPRLSCKYHSGRCLWWIHRLLSTWAYRGLAGVEIILNGVLGGLVAVTACADVVTPFSSLIVGGQAD